LGRHESKTLVLLSYAIAATGETLSYPWGIPIIIVDPVVPNLNIRSSGLPINRHCQDLQITCSASYSINISEEAPSAMLPFNNAFLLDPSSNLL